MSVSRFQVMAVLQAARAYVLGLELPSAKSWGLNRAIFYAAAKRGFKESKLKKRTQNEIEVKPIEERPTAFHLGSEIAYKAPQNTGPLCFTIGGKIQTKEEFSRQIETRFEGMFNQAWGEAIEYVKQFDKSILLSQTEFFNQVYKPQRDSFAEKWSVLAKK